MLGEGGRVQFTISSIYDRGHAGKAKIKARLIGDLDPEEWELPPKPKWMRMAHLKAAGYAFGQRTASRPFAASGAPRSEGVDGIAATHAEC